MAAQLTYTRSPHSKFQSLLLNFRSVLNRRHSHSSHLQSMLFPSDLFLRTRAQSHPRPPPLLVPCSTRSRGIKLDPHESSSPRKHSLHCLLGQESQLLRSDQVFSFILHITAKLQRGLLNVSPSTRPRANLSPYAGNYLRLTKLQPLLPQPAALPERSSHHIKRPPLLAHLHL